VALRFADSGVLVAMLAAAVGGLKLKALQEQTQPLPYRTSRRSRLASAAVAEEGVELASCAAASDAVAYAAEEHQQSCLAAVEDRCIEHSPSYGLAGGSRQRKGAYAVASCRDNAAVAVVLAGAGYQGKVAANSETLAMIAAVFGPSKTTEQYPGADTTLNKRRS